MAVEQQLEAMNVRLQAAQDQVAELSTGIDRVRAEASQAVFELKQKIATMESRGGPEKEFNLVNRKEFSGERFSGDKKENFKVWTKGVKIFCNTHKVGFKKILENIEAHEDVEVDIGVIGAMQWEAAVEANIKLYDFLCTYTSGDALK